MASLHTPSFENEHTNTDTTRKLTKKLRDVQRTARVFTFDALEERTLLDGGGLSPPVLDGVLEEQRISAVERIDGSDTVSLSGSGQWDGVDDESLYTRDAAFSLMGIAAGNEHVDNPAAVYTVTLTPDADADARITGYHDSRYALAHTAETGVVRSDTLGVGHQNRNGKHIYRSVVAVPAGQIPENATITKATITLMPHYKWAPYEDNILIVPIGEDGTPLEAVGSDYATLGTEPLAIIPSRDITVGQPLTIDIPVEKFAQLRSDDVIAFGIRTEDERDGREPASGNSGTISIEFHAVERGNGPKIEVQYVLEEGVSEEEQEESVQEEHTAHHSATPADNPAYEKIEGAHGSWVYDVVTDGQVLVSSGQDGNVHIRDAGSGELLHTVGHGNQVLDLDHHDSMFVSASYDRTVRVFGADGEVVQSFSLPGLATDVAFHPNGEHITALASGSAYHLVRATGEVHLLSSGGYNTVDSHPEHGHSYVTNAGATYVLDPETGQTINTIPSGNNSIGNVHVSPEGDVVAVGEGSQLVLYRTQDHAELARLQTQQSMVYSIAFTSDGKQVFATGYSGAVQMWNIEGVAQGHPVGEAELIIDTGVQNSALAVSPCHTALFIGGGQRDILTAPTGLTPPTQREHEEDAPEIIMVDATGTLDFGNDGEIHSGYETDLLKGTLTITTHTPHQEMTVLTNTLQITPPAQEGVSSMHTVTEHTAGSSVALAFSEPLTLNELTLALPEGSPSPTNITFVYTERAEVREIEDAVMEISFDSLPAGDLGREYSFVDEHGIFVRLASDGHMSVIEVEGEKYITAGAHPVTLKIGMHPDEYTLHHATAINTRDASAGTGQLSLYTHSGSRTNVFFHDGEAVFDGNIENIEYMVTWTNGNYLALGEVQVSRSERSLQEHGGGQIGDALSLEGVTSHTVTYMAGGMSRFVFENQAEIVAVHIERPGTQEGWSVQNVIATHTVEQREEQIHSIMNRLEYLRDNPPTLTGTLHTRMTTMQRHMDELQHLTTQTHTLLEDISQEMATAEARTPTLTAQFAELHSCTAMIEHLHETWTEEIHTLQGILNGDITPMVHQSLMREGIALQQHSPNTMTTEIALGEMEGVATITAYRGDSAEVGIEQLSMRPPIYEQDSNGVWRKTIRQEPMMDVYHLQGTGGVVMLDVDTLVTGMSFRVWSEEYGSIDVPMTIVVIANNGQTPLYTAHSGQTLTVSHPAGIRGIVLSLPDDAHPAKSGIMMGAISVTGTIREEQPLSHPLDPLHNRYVAGTMMQHTHNGEGLEGMGFPQVQHAANQAGVHLPRGGDTTPAGHTIGILVPEIYADKYLRYEMHNKGIQGGHPGHAEITGLVRFDEQGNTSPLPEEYYTIHNNYIILAQGAGRGIGVQTQGSGELLFTLDAFHTYHTDVMPPLGMQPHAQITHIHTPYHEADLGWFQVNGERSSKDHPLHITPGGTFGIEMTIANGGEPGTVEGRIYAGAPGTAHWQEAERFSIPLSAGATMQYQTNISVPTTPLGIQPVIRLELTGSDGSTFSDETYGRQPQGRDMDDAALTQREQQELMRIDRKVLHTLQHAQQNRDSATARRFGDNLDRITSHQRIQVQESERRGERVTWHMLREERLRNGTTGNQEADAALQEQEDLPDEDKEKLRQDVLLTSTEIAMREGLRQLDDQALLTYLNHQQELQAYGIDFGGQITYHGATQLHASAGQAGGTLSVRSVPTLNLYTIPEENQTRVVAAEGLLHIDEESFRSIDAAAPDEFTLMALRSFYDGEELQAKLEEYFGEGADGVTYAFFDEISDIPTYPEQDYENVLSWYNPTKSVAGLERYNMPHSALTYALYGLAQQYEYTAEFGEEEPIQTFADLQATVRNPLNSKRVMFEYTSDMFPDFRIGTL